MRDEKRHFERDGNVNYFLFILYNNNMTVKIYNRILKNILVNGTQITSK